MIVRVRVQRFLYGLATLGVLAALACPLGCPGPQPPHQDAADGAIRGTPQTFCDSLARNGCKAGLDPHCVDVVANAVDAGLTRINLTLCANAQSKDAVIACGASCE
jgi:hypothetical protein